MDIHANDQDSSSLSSSSPRLPIDDIWDQLFNQEPSTVSTQHQVTEQEGNVVEPMPSLIDNYDSSCLENLEPTIKLDSKCINIEFDPRAFDNVLLHFS